MSQELIILLVKVLVDYGPKVYLAIRALMSKTTVTEADFADLDALLLKSGEDYFKKG